ncbi:MAG: hypothetical protein H0W99_03030 [Acidobacteria bacterium]|nr:hypothetical protein [Acidobacteriota bacterium]
MKAELADYILCLSESLAHTKQANDRPLYETYLADAAILLAVLERDADVGEVKQMAHNHERLLSNTWLVGEEHKIIFAAGDRFKGLLE